MNVYLYWIRANKGTVTFLIGKDKAKFIVHKAFACHHSPALKAAFTNKRFVEGRTQTYKLEDVQVATFEQFVNWLYSKKLEINEEDPDLTLTKLWVLADKFLIPGLQNDTVRKLDAYYKEDAITLDAETLHYVYKHTAENSPLRGLWARILALHRHPSCFKEK